MIIFQGTGGRNVFFFFFCVFSSLSVSSSVVRVCGQCFADADDVEIPPGMERSDSMEIEVSCGMEG